jgi:GT2 family glycosyltransferase
MNQQPNQPAQKELGHIDSIANGAITGWAVSSRIPKQTTVLFVFIDDRAVGNITCNMSRPDLASIDLPFERAGFSWKIPIEYLDGKRHKIAIRFASSAPLKFQDEAGKSHSAATFQMEVPNLVQGHVDGLSNGAIRGWAIRTDFVSDTRLSANDIVVTHHGEEIGRVKVNRFRADVAKALDCDPYCGFSFSPPARFRTGQPFSLVFKTFDGTELENSPLEISYPQQLATTRVARLFTEVEAIAASVWTLRRELRDLLRVEISPLDAYDSWFREYRKALKSRHMQAKKNQTDTLKEPLISVVCPVFRPRLTDFRAAVDSVLRQTYTNWELILVDDKSESEELSACLYDYAKRDRRIRVIEHKKNGHISAATNTAIAAANGAYVAFFDHDDLLEDVALDVMVDAARESGAKLIYSDEDKIDDYDRFSEPNLKSDWNYRLLLCQNYVCHFLMVETDELRRAGPLNPKYDGAQDHELVLRLCENIVENEIKHVSEIIYHWRKTPGSTASEVSAKSYAVTAGAAAIKDHLKRRGFDVKVSSLLDITMFRVAWQQNAEPKVSIIIPFRDQAIITQKCLESILKNTAYKNFEVILVDNWSNSKEAELLCTSVAKFENVRVLRIEEAFNFSRLNNLACNESDAEFFVFMNNDVFVGQKDWLRNMIDEAIVDPKVGAVGAMLLYPNKTIQHAGVIVGIGDGVAQHAYLRFPENATEYMGRCLCAQELSAVTAALMLCRADSFRKVGGFDETDLPVAYNDVDLCLKLRELGFRVIWTPAVVAEHHESFSRGDDLVAINRDRFIYEEQTMYSRWKNALANDPFYNRLFSRHGVAFSDLASVSVSQFGGNASGE